MEADLQYTPLYLLSYLVIGLFGDSDTRLIICAPSDLFFPSYLVIGLFGDADIPTDTQSQGDPKIVKGGPKGDPNLKKKVPMGTHLGTVGSSPLPGFWRFELNCFSLPGFWRFARFLEV